MEPLLKNTELDYTVFIHTHGNLFWRAQIQLRIYWIYTEMFLDQTTRFYSQAQKMFLDQTTRFYSQVQNLRALTKA